MSDSDDSNDVVFLEQDAVIEIETTGYGRHLKRKVSNISKVVYSNVH